MISTSLVLLVATIICFISFLTFMSLSIWTYIKEKKNPAPPPSEDQVSSEKKKKSGKGKNNKPEVKEETKAAPEKKSSSLVYYIPLTIVSLIFTSVLAVFYLRSNESSTDMNNDGGSIYDRDTTSYGSDSRSYKDTPMETEPTLAPSRSESTSSSIVEATKNSISKMAKNYNKFESDLTPESNDGLDAIRLIEKYGKNMKNSAAPGSS